MNTSIDVFINTLAMRGITSREQLLNEMLRVKLTAKAAKLQKDAPQNDGQIYELMKQATENTILGYFPGDKDFFSAVYKSSKDIDLIECTLKLYQNDRFGQVFSPAYLTEYVCDMIQDNRPKSILITEAEKSLSGLNGILNRYRESKITLTTSHVLMFMLLKLGFEKYENVTILNQSIYQELLIEERFDFIYALPNFGGKVEAITNKYISSSSDGVAVQNLLGCLSANGTMVAVLPAKITFAGGADAKMREYITTDYQLHSIFGLPEGIFKPYTAIKTYMLTVGTTHNDTVRVGYLGYDNGLYITHEKSISYKEFVSHEDWRIELILADDDENIRKYKNSSIAKVKLHEVAEVFRGKSILKKDVKPGKILVLNISNITDAGIDYESLDNVDEEERKIKRYELVNGDVVLSCRGSAIKTGVFRKQKNIVIASANVIVIRPNDKVMGEYLKIFFESPVGMAVIKSFQRGTTIVNINHTDIMEMEMPLLSIEEQKELVAKYEAESVLYRETIMKAEERYSIEKTKIYDKLL
ncbi:restriction endonuclease subunit S [Anaeromusa acidaminophila]|uniref:restriction endonuclease subunit S n=1 Tax=Anaeromusa acidaminophila TaxID=81464 RepID=UPI0003693779|nr:restriction endonuclease subunit S [Anaeromusa acidaminophila]